jgi:hypothetical protein
MARDRSCLLSPPFPSLLLPVPVVRLAAELIEVGECDGDLPTGVVTLLESWRGEGEGIGDGENDGEEAVCGLVAKVVTFQRKLDVKRRQDRKYISWLARQIIDAGCKGSTDITTA